ncbi:hypothetical protein [Pseudomonas qingdaonensis]|uniref:hypothetical protein n=1 Tax=Pseudomonas qingdaonensis TaxID=2056231 RepID=UPI002431E1DB|nr:hypothetical protein [Pseudomonas qingdaonensis]
MNKIFNPISISILSTIALATALYITTDYEKTITTAAVIVALSVALKDTYLRSVERKHKAACFMSYHRPATELLLQRLICIDGTFSKHYKIRLGATRPYDAIRITNLIIRKKIWWNTEKILDSLAYLPTDKATLLGSILGELPLLESDFETLALFNSSVPISENDQELIKAIKVRLKIIIKNLTTLLELKEKKLKLLAESYKETIMDGKEQLRVCGFSS